MAAARNKVAHKLDELMVSFGDFESSMKEGTRQRREQDEQRLLELKHDMGQLEVAVSTEIKQRTEVNKALQAWCEEQLDSISEALSAKVEVRTERLEKNVRLLATRIADVEAHFEEEKERITAEIRRRNKQLKDELDAFMLAFEAEKADRLRREAAIVKRQADHETVTEQRFAAERKEREERHMALRERLEDHVAARAKADERFQAFVAEEIVSAKNEIATETKTREAEDDEIVEAMNRYTRKLQASLHIINSTDT